MYNICNNKCIGVYITMLYPQMNAKRMLTQLSGFWKFAMDKENNGESKNWQNGIPADHEVAVGASWNEQFQDLMYFFDTGWYETSVVVPTNYQSERVWLRVGAANYLSKVWINGQYVGLHEGPHLPFEFDISDYVKFGEENQIIIAVDAQIKPDRLPPGDVEDEQIIGFKGQYPNNYFDFFPYGGINRPVYIYTTSKTHIQSMTVTSEVADATAIVHYEVKLNADFTGSVQLQLSKELTEEVQVDATDLIKGQLTVKNPRLWSMEDPHLYNFKVDLYDGENHVDSYTLKTGIRTVELVNNKLVLNGKEVFLKGFGLHEDFAVLGKGMNHAVIAKDMNLLKWIGANSFRTSHYPYSEEFLQYADSQGMLVIGETPFVGFVKSHYTNDRILNHAKQVIQEMIERDKNHPSIIAWSLANEGDTSVPEAGPFYKKLYECAKSLEPTRPITIVNCVAPEKDYALEYYDFVSINRYYGWYEQTGRLDEGCSVLSEKLDEVYEVFKKPIMITEFGADAVAGLHIDPPEAFSEEYQAEMVTRQYKIMEEKPYVMGAHIWAFADFKTSQTPSRVIVNRKGLFTRDRQPKLAAHMIRKEWIQN